MAEFAFVISQAVHPLRDVDGVVAFDVPEYRAYLWIDEKVALNSTNSLRDALSVRFDLRRSAQSDFTSVNIYAQQQATRSSEGCLRSEWNVLEAQVYLSAEGIQFASDFAGQLPLYFAQSGKAFVVSSNAFLAGKLAFGRVQPDATARSAHISFGFYPDASSPVAGVYRAVGRTTYQFDVHAGALMQRDRPGWYELVSGSSEFGVPRLSDARDALIFAAQKALANQPKNTKVRIGLSGGRDSRILFAMLALLDVPADAVTISTGAQEDFAIASQLVAVSRDSGHDVTHHHVDKRAAETDTWSFESWLDALRGSVVSRSGVLMPGQYFSPSRLGTNADGPSTIGLSGVWGELLRAYRYKPEQISTNGDLPAGHARRVVRRLLTARRMTSNTSNDVVDRLYGLLRPTLERMSDLPDHSALDLFGAEQHHSRRYMLLNKPLLSNPVLLAYGFAQPARARAESQVPRSIIRALSPKMDDVRYTHETPPTSVRRAAARHAPLHERFSLLALAEEFQVAQLFARDSFPGASKWYELNGYQKDRFSRLVCHEVSVVQSCALISNMSLTQVLDMVSPGRPRDLSP